MPALPPKVRSYLNKNYSGGKLNATATGCLADYKRTVITGDFDGDKRLDYAVKIIRGHKGYFIAFLRRETEYEAHILLSLSSIEMRNMGMTIAKKGEKYLIGDIEDNRFSHFPYDAPVIGVCESEACP